MPAWVQFVPSAYLIRDQWWWKCVECENRHPLGDYQEGFYSQEAAEDAAEEHNKYYHAALVKSAGKK